MMINLKQTMIPVTSRREVVIVSPESYGFDRVLAVVELYSHNIPIYSHNIAMLE